MVSRLRVRAVVNSDLLSLLFSPTYKITVTANVTLEFSWIDYQTIDVTVTVNFWSRLALFNFYTLINLLIDFYFVFFTCNN